MRRLGKPQQVIAVSRFGSLAAREEFASYGIPIWTADLSVQEEVENASQCGAGLLSRRGEDRDGRGAGAAQAGQHRSAAARGRTIW